jgi:tRNA nucleotidyltransferase/poly(A) polymerase
VGLPTKTSYDDAKKTIQALLDAGYQAMFAGGCVRDRLLGKEPKDFDVATTAQPEKTTTIFKKLGYRVIPTGLDHGTVSIMTHSGPVEITTLRHDIETDGRHAVVDFKNVTFETDAARRDFTINAMFEDIEGKIHDFFNGKSDLNAKVLRFVGDPSHRIREDYLRILRLFRFWARLDFTPATGTLKCISSEIEGLRQISQERITSELWGIFCEPHAKNPLFAMEQCGVTQIIFSESIVFDPRLHACLHSVASTTPTLRPWLTMSLLLGILHNKSWPAEALHTLTRRLRLSEKDGQTLFNIFHGFDQISTLTPLTTDVASILDLAEDLEARGPDFTLANFFGPIWRFIGETCSDPKFLTNLNHVLTTDETFQIRRKATLPVNGRDLLELHPTIVGSAIGDAMSVARRAFRNGEWTNRNEGLLFLKKIN